MTVELPESIINGRFKYSEKPLASPGKCAVCGAVDKPVIDFGMDLDYYGAVYICVECMRAAMTVIDLVEGLVDPATQVVPLQFLDVEAVNEYLARTNVATGALNSILASYIAARAVDEQPAEESSNTDADTKSESNRIDESSPAFTFDEGPTSVSTSSGERLPSITDL